MKMLQNIILILFSDKIFTIILVKHITSYYKYILKTMQSRTLKIFFFEKIFTSLFIFRIKITLGSNYILSEQNTSLFIKIIKGNIIRIICFWRNL